MTFKEFNFSQQLLEGIDAIGFENATPIQEQAIPVIMQGKDLIASAQTGTGKTAAFLLPIINQIMEGPQDEKIKALIIVPTRELAMQIDQQMEGLSYFTNVSSISVYGGSGGSEFTREKQALTQGVDVIIGTPGRLIAHLNMGYGNFENLQFLVLDEADRMLDMGFHDDIVKILSHLPKKRQNLLFSATMPKKIKELANKILHDPEEISLAVSKPAERVYQYAFIVYEEQKIPVLKHMLSAKPLNSVLIFCSTKIKAKQVRKELKNLNFDVQEIHSDLDQKERNEVLAAFKNKKLNYLVATDILSRGIDVEDIELVVNFDVPGDVEDYIHRIGRTARAASKGIAFTFVSVEDQRKYNAIEKHLGYPLTKGKIPEKFGETPELKTYSGKPGGKRKFTKKSNKKRSS
ncbi:MAG: DEAD/DEAH box helicase [Cyclobacteriaceae bacterium]